MTREEVELLRPVIRWARANHWHPSRMGWVNADTIADATLAIRIDDNGQQTTGASIGRKLPGRVLSVRWEPLPATSVRQAVDVLCALGVLPGELSSTYWAGVESVEEWFPLPLAPYAEYLRQFATPEAVHA